jgi:hypothetical protein
LGRSDGTWSFVVRSCPGAGAIWDILSPARVTRCPPLTGKASFLPSSSLARPGGWPRVAPGSPEWMLLDQGPTLEFVELVQQYR